jgi:uncharacterized protein (DUF305 family)
MPGFMRLCAVLRKECCFLSHTDRTTEADMTQLSALTTPEFDILFLQLMIDHHEGALAMVRMIENSSNDEAALLAQEIINAQKAEIEEMTLLLGSLSGA